MARVVSSPDRQAIIRAHRERAARMSLRAALR
jgi:hypothetical protein